MKKEPSAERTAVLPDSTEDAVVAKPKEEAAAAAAGSAEGGEAGDIEKQVCFLGGKFE